MIDKIDKVFVINVDSEILRYKKVSGRLSSLGIPHERFSAIKAADIIDEFKTKKGSKIKLPGELACLKSHIEIVKYAKLNGLKKILILEDDVVFSKNFLEKLNKINIDFNMLFLGANQKYWDGIKFFDNYYVSKKTMGAFAYIIDHNFYDKILNIAAPELCPIDYYYLLLQSYEDKIYTCYPNIVIADIYSSTIRDVPKNFNFKNHFKLLKWNIGDYDHE